MLSVYVNFCSHLICYLFDCQAFTYFSQLTLMLNVYMYMIISMLYYYIVNMYVCIVVCLYVVCYIYHITLHITFNVLYMCMLYY